MGNFLISSLSKCYTILKLELDGLNTRALPKTNRSLTVSAARASMRKSLSLL